MTTRLTGNENANAEIIGVVILIGIFAITAGILSATVFASPEPEKVPAASIEVTKASDTPLIRITHLGGDPLPLDPAGRPRTKWTAPPTDTGAPVELARSRSEPISALDNGFSGEGLPRDGSRQSWSGRAPSGESVIASWDPTGIYGPLGPGTPSGGDLGQPYVPVNQPPMPVAHTVYNNTTDAVHADFTFLPGPFLIGESIHFANESTGPITNRAWYFGDATATMSDTDPDHSYTHEGNYSVSLTVWNEATGASDTMVKSVVVQPSAIGDLFIFDVTPTVGSRILSVTCSDPTTLGQTIWQWTFTDGLTGISTRTEKLTETQGRSVVHTFYNNDSTINNICRIDLTVWSPYVSDPIVFETQTVVVAPPLRADFEMNRTAGVSPQAVLFMDHSSGLPETWAWNFGDGTTSTEQNPVHIFTVGPEEIRTFTVTLTVDRADSEPDTTTKEITIWPPVAARFSSNVTQGEAPLTVQFTDQSTGFVTGWFWNFGDGLSSTEPNPVHRFTTNGTYDVTLFVERATDPNPETHSASLVTIPIYIRVGPKVTADFSATPTEGVEPLSVVFTDMSVSADPVLAPVITWFWDFGDGTNSTEQNPTHIFATADTYTITLTAANKFREDTMTKIGYITVHPRVTASFTSNVTAVPVNGDVAFTDTSTSGDPISAPINFWRWDFGDDSPIFEGSDPAVNKNPVHTYTKKGIYTVSLTTSNGYHTVHQPSVPLHHGLRPGDGRVHRQSDCRERPRWTSSSRTPRPGTWTPGSGTSRATAWLIRAFRTRQPPLPIPETTP
jgi:PKD repeat protein